MQKIIPHLWFDKEAKEAAEFYTSVFGGDSRVTNLTTIENTPSGNCDLVSFVLAGQKFMAISAGSFFQFNPSVSFMIHCQTAEEVDRFWDKLFEGGTALMPLDSYPFSERYGWLQDKYGLSWQIMYNPQKMSQKITPALLFTGDLCGKAEEAINLYISVFHHSHFDAKERYEKGKDPNAEGLLKFASYTLEGQKFSAMDSGFEHGFSFNEAISFLVNCEDQSEIDYYWEKLSAIPEAEQCGWIKDKYGLSWQISSKKMEEMMQTDDKEKLNRVTKAFLKMKKLDLAELKKAYQG